MSSWNSGQSIYEASTKTIKSSTTESIVTAKLPTTGDPNSKSIEYNPDGTPKRYRWYDSEGNVERDRDFNHSGNVPFPHDHEWKDGKRGKDHLEPYQNILVHIILTGLRSVL